jgi:hypothetical protein
MNNISIETQPRQVFSVCCYPVAVDGLCLGYDLYTESKTEKKASDFQRLYKSAAILKGKVKRDW